MYKLSFTLIAVIFLSACGSSGGGSGSSDKKGVFLDSAVEGIRFVTNSKSGTTDANGSFSYQQGETIKFYIGDILLGSATAKATMTPVDLVPGATDETNSQVTNIIRFLLTLDSDNNFNNGIQIDSSVISAATGGQSVDFTLSITAFENDSSVRATLNFLTQGMPGGARTFVSIADARTHFRGTLNNITSGGTNVASGNSGTLTISGADTGTIGSSFSPNVATIDTRPSLISSSVNTSLSWLTNSGTSFSPTAITSSINVSIIDGNLAQVLFVTVTPGSSQTFSYVLSCALDPTAECSKLAIDLTGKTATFNDVKISNQPGVSDATAPVTLNNTLTWQ